MTMMVNSIGCNEIVRASYQHLLGIIVDTIIESWLGWIALVTILTRVGSRWSLTKMTAAQLEVLLASDNDEI